jgi:MFS family permease
MTNFLLSKKIIIFGFIFTFFSSFGQSFFLGLFNAPIRNELGITHGQFGNIYAVATIFSSLLFIWAGKKIDDFRLLNYSYFVIILLFFSTLFFSFINNIYFLAVGIFLMRFSGQGLMSHTSSTAISRYFEKSRGKALSTIWFGLSSAEFILPVLIIYFLTIYSWRSVWQGISIMIILILPLVINFTIKNINFNSRESNSRAKLKTKIKSWKRKIKKIKEQNAKKDKHSRKRLTKKGTVCMRIRCFLLCVFLLIFAGVLQSVFSRFGGRSVPNGSYLGTLFQPCRSKVGKLKTMVSFQPSTTFQSFEGLG